MTLFIDRFPDSNDVERLKLLLSTFTDGSGENGEGDLPGGFNFERVAAEWLNGIHIPGTKHIYDVVVQENGKTYGYSCKMRRTLNDAEGPHGDCTIEVSNAGALFITIAEQHGVTASTLQSTDGETLKQIGEKIVGHIDSWHHSAKTKDGGTYEQGSIMLHLAWSAAKKAKKNKPAQPEKFKLFVFDRHIATPQEISELTWSARKSTLIGKRIGKNGEWVRAIEIYIYSGGHVKYYPRAQDAIWHSGEPFELQQAPRQKHVLSAKAHGYWPSEWKEAGGELPSDQVTEDVSKAATE